MFYLRGHDRTVDLILSAERADLVVGEQNHALLGRAAVLPHFLPPAALGRLIDFQLARHG